MGSSPPAFSFNDRNAYYWFRYTVWVEAPAVRIYVEVWFEVGYESFRMLLHEAGEAFSSIVKRRSRFIEGDEKLVLRLVRGAYILAARESGGVS